MPEAKLAREAELPYATVAMVTDYDCWRIDEKPVDVSEVIACLKTNSKTARGMIEQLVKALPAERAASPIDTALEHAIITDRTSADPDMISAISRIAPRLFAKG